jgi:hypothetical protein
VTVLRAAVEDLDTQIEEQRLKIQNTPNKMLRVCVHYIISPMHTVWLWLTLYMWLGNRETFAGSRGHIEHSANFDLLTPLCVVGNDRH